MAFIRHASCYPGREPLFILNIRCPVTLFLAMAFRPFLALFLFGCIAMPISLALSYVIPNGRIKTILYDRRLQQRRPLVFWSSWCVIIGALIFVISLYM